MVLAQPITPSKGPARSGAFHLALSATTQPDKNLAGFLTLLNGLLGPAGITIPKPGSAFPTKRADANTPPRFGAGDEKARPAGEKAVKTKEQSEGAGARTDQPPRNELFQNQDLERNPNLAAVIGMDKIPNSGVSSEYPPAQSRSRSSDSKAYTPPSEDVGLHFLATSLTTLHSTPSSIPLSSVRDVAFGLRLTPQPTASASDAVSMHSGSDATLSAPLHPSNPNDISKLPSMRTGLGEGPASANEAETGYSKLPLQNQVQVFQEPAQEADRPASSPLLAEPFALGEAATTDFAIRERADFRHPEIPAIIGAQTASAGSRVQNGMPTGRSSLPATGSSATSAKTISSKPLSSDPLVIPVEIDPEPRGFVSEIAPKRDHPEFHPLMFGHGANPPEAPPPKETLNSLNPDQHENGFTESKRSSHLEAAAISPAAPYQPGKSANDSQSSAGQVGGNTESDEKALRSLLPHKNPQIQNSQDLTGLPTDGDLLIPSAAPGAATAAITRASAPQPPQAPAASTDIEAKGGSPSHPIREMSLRLTSPTNQVDVQLSARPGGLQVAVRTRDPDLAKSLQSNLGELVGNLEQRGFRADAWTPMDTQPRGLAFKETSDNKGHSDASGSQGGQPNPRGQQESSQQQQERRKAQFEESLARARQQVNTWRREAR
jgi:hypothetical protein